MKLTENEINFEHAVKRMEAVRKKRGYLMPHHGLLALTAPGLLEGYDACYSSLTLGNRFLEESDKEFVWLGILAVKEEFLATQHVPKYLEAGGSSNLVKIALRLAAYAKGASTFEFADTYWKNHLPNYDGRREYKNGITALVNNEGLEDGLLHITMAAIHTSIRNWIQLEWHLSWAYLLEVPETHISEALSYSMFTGSIPNFIEGCEVWRKMIVDEKVAASEPFKLWAETEQSGPA